MASTNRDYSILLTVRADLQDALGKVSSLDSSLKSLKSTGLELAGALGVGFSVASIVDFIKQTIEADQQLGNLAKTTGLSTEQLSALQQEAKKAGFDVDTLAAAMVNLSKGATGQSAQAAKALQVMGISAKDANGNIKPMADLLQQVAAKFATYEDGTSKAALATAVFGRTGAQLIPLLNQIGTEGLDNLTQKAVAAGTAVGGDAVRAAEQFGNAMDTLRAKLQGAVNEGLEQFTPQIQDLAKEIDDPRFQQALIDTANAIALIAKNAIDAAGKIAEFTRNAADIFAFHQTGAVQSDAGYTAALSRQQALQDELARRASAAGGSLGSRGNELASSLSTLTNPFNVSPTANADAAQQAALALKSDAALKAELASLTTEINRYRAESNQAAAKNPQEGDERGLFVGEGGTTQAPVLPTTTDLSAANAMAAALQQLQDKLATLRTQGLDPTATAWAQYNKTVADATATAKKAGNTPQAEATLNAVVVEAARIRDAALADIAQKDQQAWQELLGTLGTPVQVNIADALKKIQQLTDLMKRAPKSAADFQQALKNIGEGAVTDLPKYRDPTIRDAGAFSQLQQNYAAEVALEKNYNDEKLALDQQFNDKDEAQHQAHVAALAKLDKEYAQQSTTIERARQELVLDASAQFFGDLATLSSSSNKKIAAIGKAAAIAQTLVKTYQSATEAYASLAGIPYVGPALGAAAAAAAIAAGLANVAQIRAQGTGYAEGGYTGPGAKHQIAGVVHAGEVVWSQADVARAGGVGPVETMRLRGYADGGLVTSPFVSGPSPAELGLTLPASSRVQLPSPAALQPAPPVVNIKAVLAMNPDEIAHHVLNTPTGQKAIVVTVGDNPRAIQGKWSSG
jgi:hypothetical protein